MYKNIKIGCGEWGFRELPLEEHFQIANELGFQWLEFGIGGGQKGRLADELSDNEIQEFIEMGKDYHLATPFGCLENDFTLPDEDSHLKMVQYVLRQIPLLAKLGATSIRLFAGFTPIKEITPEIWDRMIMAFRLCQQECCKFNLNIAIETHGRISMQGNAAVHEHTVSTHPLSLQKLIQELPEAIGFNYDPGNLKAVNPLDTTYLLPLLNDRINYCHLKDWKPFERGWVACAIGDDDLDFGSLLRQMHYEGVYLIEYEPVDDVKEGIQRSLNYLKRIDFL